MKISEFFNRFYFHDSLMEGISYEGLCLTFNIHLCWWMQREYKPNDEEGKKIKLVFDPITDFYFEGENSDIDSDTIFEFSIPQSEINNDSPLIKIVFGDGNDIKVIRFRTSCVDLFWE